MSRWLRALLVSAVATCMAAAVLHLLPGSEESPPKRRKPAPKSHEDIVDELSDVEKKQMLRELGYHV